MRESKFRVWNGRNNQMGKVTYLNLEVPFIELDGYSADLTWGRLNPDCIVMQYIGHRDKNGKEIYEGDLIKDSDSEFIGEVIWDDDALCFTTRFQTNELWGFSPRKGKDNHCEVIGNIYENEELLNADKR